MLMNDALSGTLVLIILAAAVISFSIVARQTDIHPEAIRKSLHIAMGLVTLSFPWLFSSVRSVLFLAVGGLIFFITLRVTPVLFNTLGRSIYGIQRRSWGEFYFILGVCITWLFSQTTIEYCIAILIMVFADTAAAMIGTHYGRHGYYSSASRKTLEGNAAFYIVSIIAVWIPLSIAGQAVVSTALCTAATVAMAGTLTEALTGRGLDNLAVPAVVLFVLRYTDSISIPIAIILVTTGFLFLRWCAGPRDLCDLRESYVGYRSIESAHAARVHSVSECALYEERNLL